jgi:hypothetical protein
MSAKTYASVVKQAELRQQASVVKQAELRQQATTVEPPTSGNDKLSLPCDDDFSKFFFNMGIDIDTLPELIRTEENPHYELYQYALEHCWVSGYRGLGA